MALARGMADLSISTRSLVSAHVDDPLRDANTLEPTGQSKHELVIFGTPKTLIQAAHWLIAVTANECRVEVHRVVHLQRLEIMAGLCHCNQRSGNLDPAAIRDVAEKRKASIGEIEPAVPFEWREQVRETRRMHDVVVVRDEPTPMPSKRSPKRRLDRPHPPWGLGGRDAFVMDTAVEAVAPTGIPAYIAHPTSNTPEAAFRGRSPRGATAS